MKKKIFVFTLLTFFAKIFAFGRELFLSYYYGASEISDVFLLSMTIPLTIFGFVSTGITSGFIPLFHQIKENRSSEEALLFCSRITNFILLICMGFIIVYYVFAEKLLRIFAVGFSDETMSKAIAFTNYSIWAILAIALSAIFTSYLQINDQVNITAISQIPQNIGILITIILSVVIDNVMVLPVGFVISSFSQTCFLLFFCIRTGYRYTIAFSFRDQYVHSFLIKLGMLTISSSILQINTLIDRTLATSVRSGGLSLFEYAGTINNLFMGLTIIPISTALYPQLARSCGDNIVFSRIVADGIKMFIIIMIPLSFFVVAFSREVVTAIYGRGEFGVEEISATAGIVVCYSLGLVAYAIRELLSKAYYACGDAKTPMVNASIALMLNIVLNLIFVKILGLNGLALATTISAVLMTFMLWKSKKNEVILSKGNRILITATLSVIASFIGILISKFLFDKILVLIHHNFFSLAVSGIIFAVIYLSISTLIGVFNIEDVKKILKK